jgi:invasion protein IalB
MTGGAAPPRAPVKVCTLAPTAAAGVAAAAAAAGAATAAGAAAAAGAGAAPARAALKASAAAWPVAASYVSEIYKEEYIETYRRQRIGRQHKQPRHQHPPCRMIQAESK